MIIELYVHNIPTTLQVIILYSSLALAVTKVTVLARV